MTTPIPQYGTQTPVVGQVVDEENNLLCSDIPPHLRPTALPDVQDGNRVYYRKVYYVGNISSFCCGVITTVIINQLFF